MITKEMKEQIIKEYGRTEGDTGSPEVQVALLTSKLTRRITTQEEDFLRWLDREEDFLHTLRRMTLKDIVH